MTEIITQAKPDSASLVLARQACAADEELRKLFQDPPSVDWLADNLSVRLSARWGGRDFGLAWEVALYLADEFFQTKTAPVIVADQVTGQALANLPADAIWMPSPVLRESGNLVQPRPRLRPDIESELIVRHHDQAREQLALRHEGYTRHENKAVLTQAGRLSTAEQAYTEAVRLFCTDLPAKLPISLGRGQRDVALVGQCRLKMPDHTAMNLAFAFDVWLKNALAQQWRNALAGLIVESAESAPEVSTASSATIQNWIGSPDQLRWVLQTHSENHTQYVWGDTLVGISGVAFVVDTSRQNTPSCGNIICHVLNDTWCVEATLSVRVTRLDGAIWKYDQPATIEHQAQVVR